MITYKECDILQAEENIIVQSINHKGIMGAGLAKEIKLAYPDIELQYKEICKTISFERCRRANPVYWYQVSKDKFIASVFGQDGFGRDKRYTDYYALANGFEEIRLMAESRVYLYSVAIPYKIGCGLGGGNWEFVKDIISDVFKYSPEINIVIYKI